MEKIKVKLIGEDGNIFNLVGIASKKMRRAGLTEESKQMQTEVFAAESYSDALMIIGKYVDIV